MQVDSPITKTSNVEKLSCFQSSITSDSKFIKKSVENWLCLDTGLIFNASGARGYEASFFMDEYDLHSEDAYAEFKYYESNKAIGLYSDISNFLRAKLDFKCQGSAIDIGCGKGLLLKELEAQLDNWEFFAIEPSKNALRYFQKVLPNVYIHNGLLETSPFTKTKFDLVLANGVLEHVPAPLTFLEQLRDMVSPNGHIFIGVPNFVNNPADLLTFDHLSKFTPESIKHLFKLAGLRVVAEACPDDKVPMWYLLSSEPSLPSYRPVGKEVVAYNRAHHESALKWLNGTLASYQNAIDKADQDSIAMYGTGTIGQYAFGAIEGFIDKVSYIFDDNDSLWGKKKAGITIFPLEKSRELEFSQMVLSANPCYQKNMLKKAKNYQSSGKFDINEP